MNITTVDNLIKHIIELLPCIDDESVNDMDSYFTDSSKAIIISANRDEIEALADFFDQLYGDPQLTTGCYKHNLYYLSIA